MRHWLLDFARKLLPSQRLRQPIKRAGRPASFVRLELLEDRLVPSGLSDEVSSAVYASLSNGVSLSPAGATVTLMEGTVSTTGLSGPGLDRLIQALQQLPSDSVELITPPTVAPVVLSHAGTLSGDTGGALSNDTGGETTNEVPGNAAVPTPPASPQTGVTVTVSAGTFSAAGAGAVESVSVSAPQTESGRVENAVSAANPSFDPIAVETGQPAIAGGAVAGPGALQAPQPAFPDVGSPSRSFPDENGSGYWTSSADLSDGSLLKSFAANREQSAFTTLVQRHEPSVLRVCTQVLGDSDRARDASQATFQTLARRAGSLDGQGPIGGWLSTVAYHLALRYRANDVRRRLLERAAVARSADEDVLDPADGLEREELRAVVGEELKHLPPKYRLPLILLFIDGRTHAEVAREVGLPLGSIARRIDEALGRLRDRLITRGFPF